MPIQNYGGSQTQPAAHNEPPPLPSIEVFLFSYTDDINPLIITPHASAKEHNNIRHRVDDSLIQEVKTHHLTWHYSKNERLTFNRAGPVMRSITLGSRLNFQHHIDLRAQKAQALLSVMLHLGNSHGLKCSEQPTYRRHLTHIDKRFRTLETEGSQGQHPRHAETGIPGIKKDYGDLPRGQPHQIGVHSSSGATPTKTG